MIIIMVTMSMVMWLDSSNFLEYEFIKNKKFILYHPKSDIHNTWITQARVPTSTLTFSNTPTDQEQRVHSGVGIACNHAWPWAWSMDDWWNLEDFIQNWHRANLGPPPFTTHSLYLSCTSHSSRNLQSSWARGMTQRWKSKLAKRTKNEQSLLKITKMDAISGGGALLAPSGDYVLMAPSGDYNQSIPPKSTNRIRCFASRTVLLPTSAKLTCAIWEINRGKILVLTVTVFKNIQEHSMKFKNIRGYSNGKIKFKNIQDFRRTVRTLFMVLLSDKGMRR